MKSVKRKETKVVVTQLKRKMGMSTERKGGEFLEEGLVRRQARDTDKKDEL